MVAKISVGNSLFGALTYNQEKIEAGKASVLSQNNIKDMIGKGENILPFAMRIFELYLLSNHRIEKPVVHISLNPDPKDRLTDGQLREIAKEYMQKMGFGEQPYLVYKHEDIDRHHLHIVTVRVDKEGKKINDSFEHRRSMDACREIEQKYGLHIASEKESLSEDYKLKKVNVKKGNVKQQLSNTIKEVSKTYTYLSFNEYRTLLSLFNIEAEEVRGEREDGTYKGLVYYATDDKGNKTSQPFKSSLFGKTIGYDAIQKRIDKNIEAAKSKQLKTHCKMAIDQAFQSAKTKGEFIKQLRSKNIDVIFRENQTGRIYGVTFIDHQNKVVLNGSRLGKEYSANAFENHFNQLHQGEAPAPKATKQKELPAGEFDFQSTSSGLFDLLPDPNPYIPYDEEYPKIKRKKKKKKGRSIH